MKIVTWNVNSVKARLPHLVDYLDKNRPEVVLLQELKCETNAFPLEPLEDLGYQVEAFGQKTYNGVAILSSIGIEDVSCGNPFFQDDQARVIEAVVGGKVRVISVYVPNGQALDSPKYTYKLAFLDAFETYLRDRLSHDEHLIVGGDFNIAPADKDVYDPKIFQNDILCSPAERLKLRSLFNLGLTDALRHFYPSDTDLFTWWDYRGGAFLKNHGLRIDHLLLSPSAIEIATHAGVDYSEREKERPSDHAPVWVRLSL